MRIKQSGNLSFNSGAHAFTLFQRNVRTFIPMISGLNLSNSLLIVKKSFLLPSNTCTVWPCSSRIDAMYKIPKGGQVPAALAILLLYLSSKVCGGKIKETLIILPFPSFFYIFCCLGEEGLPL